MSEEEAVRKILEKAKDQVKLENRTGVFKEGRKLKSEDLKIPQDPEEFTKRHIIEKVFQILNVHFETGEARFTVPSGTRKVDYAPKTDNTIFLVEAKPINSDLYDRSKDGAVNQIKGLFLLDEVKKKYGFGVATDGLKWIIINPRQEIIADFSLEEDFKKIRDFLIGKREAKKERKQEEISKRFYEWYNALLHGGSFRDLKGRQRSISEADCLVNNVQNVSSAEDREEIAQAIIDRLIFIKFLQAKGLIKSDVLEYLASLSQTALNWKLNNLFFNVLNTEKKRRSDVDPKFADIPYLNGSLFTKTKPEERNQYYTVKAEILRRVIEFLDSFRFVSESEVEGGEEALDPEILGYIFERAMTTTDRKGTGAYYTPKYITRYISENTAYPLLLDRINQFLREEKGYRETELLNSIDELYTKVSDTTLADINIKILPKITVCDPACGSGAFLLASADVLFEIHRKIRDKMGTRSSDVALKKIILQNNIFGVDINHKGIEIAKLRLWLWLAQSYDPEGKIEPLPNIEYNLRPGNSLVGFVDVSVFKEIRVSMDDFLAPEESLVELMNRRDPLIDEYRSASGERAKELRREIEGLNNKIKIRLDAQLFNELKAKVGITPEQFAKLDVFHWGFEFHEIFSNGSGDSGFDVVIGNPPYVRIYRGVLDDKQVQYWKTRYVSAHMKFDLYVLFIDMSIDLLNSSGYFSMIVPDKFMNTPYGEPLREKIINQTQIKSILDLRELSIFEGVTVANVIPTLKNRKDGESTFPILELKDEKFVEVNRISQDILLTSSDNSFRLSKRVEDTIIIEKIKEISIPFDRIFYVNWGLRTGTKEKTEEFVVNSSTHPLSHPMIRGENITNRYELIEPREYIIYDKEQLYNSMFEEFFENPKIVFRKISGKAGLMAVSDTEKMYCFSTLIPCVNINYVSHVKRTGIPKSTPESKSYNNHLYTLSVVNSKLIRWYYDKNLSDKLSVVPNHIKQLPIRSIHFTTPSDERERLVGEFKDLYEKGSFDRILTLVESYLPKDTEGNFITAEEKSDVVHDMLAHLAKQMIELNKEKQSEIKGFHNWLEDYIKINVDDMTLKSKVKEYYNVDWNEMQKILTRNNGKITELDITGREPQEKIKEEFESSKSKLNPLLDRIKDTDRLIDQIVYKLYGLTPVEIKVVDGDG